EHLAFFLDQGAMPLADQGAGRPQVTLRVAANEELGKFDFQDFSFLLPRCQYEQTQFHVATSLLPWDLWLRMAGAEQHPCRPPDQHGHPGAVLTPALAALAYAYPLYHDARNSPSARGTVRFRPWRAPLVAVEPRLRYSSNILEEGESGKSL